MWRKNFLDAKSCAAINCHQSGADIFPVDIGMAVDTPRVEKRKVAYGTKNFAKEKAMTREQAVQALETGINLVGELKEKGYSLIATVKWELEILPPPALWELLF